jgi:purine-binding chemotaxis protein CheW
LEENEDMKLEDTLKGKYLTFIVSRETYGIEIRYVTEIVGIEEITEMPEMPEYMMGIINLRGKIIPVMDVRLRFMKDRKEYDDRTCIIVVSLQEVLTGLIVDSVSDVLSIQEDGIVDLPESGTLNKRGFVKKIGKAEGNVILLLDCEKLLFDMEADCEN